MPDESLDTHPKLIFNYDYRGHRAGIVEQDNFNDDQLQPLRDLTNPDVPAPPSSNVKSC